MKSGVDKISILQLRPTQFVLGMHEVDFKISHMKKMTKKELATYRKTHVVPIVLGPKNQMYLIDHHHFMRACWEAGSDNYDLKVIEDLSRHSEAEFWNIMVKKKWCYLHDQF